MTKKFSNYKPLVTRTVFLWSITACLSVLTFTIFRRHHLVATITNKIIRLLQEASLKAKYSFMKSETFTLG